MRTVEASYRGFQAGRSGALRQLHAGLLGRPVGLAGVAGDAGERAVLPGGLTALGAWEDVVDRQLLRARTGAAVLAGGVVALEDVATAERDRVVTRPVVPGQGEHLGHAEAEPDRPDEQLAVAGRQLRPVGPLVEPEVVGIDDVGRLVPEQDQRPRDRGDVNGLPVAVEHQCRSLQNAHTHDDELPARSGRFLAWDLRRKVARLRL